MRGREEWSDDHILHSTNSHYAFLPLRSRPPEEIIEVNIRLTYSEVRLDEERSDKAVASGEISDENCTH